MKTEIVEVCDTCTIIRNEAKQAGHKPLPKLERAVHRQLVHDGIREHLVFLCEQHLTIALALALKWGHRKCDRYIAWAANTH